MTFNKAKKIWHSRLSRLDMMMILITINSTKSTRKKVTKIQHNQIKTANLSKVTLPNSIPWTTNKLRILNLVPITINPINNLPYHKINLNLSIHPNQRNQNSITKNLLQIKNNPRLCLIFWTIKLTHTRQMNYLI